MMTMRSYDRKNKPLTGKKVLIWFLGFFFVVFGANMVMAWFAVTTFSGVQTEDAYARGRDFNQEIARAENQQALGWSISVETKMEGEMRLFVTMTIKDASGDALEAMRVEGQVVRPVRKGIDQPAVFAHLGGGRYGSGLALPKPGKWQLQVRVQDAAGRERRIVHDISVRS